VFKRFSTFKFQILKANIETRRAFIWGFRVVNHHRPTLILADMVPTPPLPLNTPALL